MKTERFSVFKERNVVDHYFTKYLNMQGTLQIDYFLSMSYFTDNLTIFH